ncbi:MAG TPA: helix-turn-helix domain-containing protein [Gemmata sp.]|nr:helix-turn-helix domain-containing protein [Gemmata sp.]
MDLATQAESGGPAAGAPAEPRPEVAADRPELNTGAQLIPLHELARVRRHRWYDTLTTGRASAALGIAPRTVTKWCDSGKLRSRRIPLSRDRRIARSDLIAFLLENKAESFIPPALLTGTRAAVFGIDVVYDALPECVVTSDPFEFGSLASVYTLSVVAVGDSFGRDVAARALDLVRREQPGAARIYFTVNRQDGVPEAAQMVVEGDLSQLALAIRKSITG